MDFFARGLLGLLLAAIFTTQSYAAETTHKVRMYWSYGEIEIDLFGDDSPRHVSNFLQYVDSARYDGSYCHRSNAGSSLLFVQGGSFTLPSPLSLSTLTSEPIPTFHPVDNEFDASNGLSNSPASLAAARTSNPDSATSGWFFNVTDNSTAFDQGPYTVFGEVTSGWDNFSQLPYQPLIQNIFSSGYSSTVSTAPLVNTGTSENPQWTIPTFDRWVRIPTTPGDYNLDGLVNAADEAVWEAGQGDYATANLTADGDSDGDVDDDDHAIWQANLGEGTLRDVLGDYNGSGAVTDADYLWWQTLYGSSVTLDADGNSNGTVDTADYTVWRDSLAANAALATSPAPEPSAGALLLVTSLWLARRKRK